MSVSPDFRSWAARVADQAASERDDREVLRLADEYRGLLGTPCRPRGPAATRRVQDQNAPTGFLGRGAAPD
jgi:hypothetical protein